MTFQPNMNGNIIQMATIHHQPVLIYTSRMLLWFFRLNRSIVLQSPSRSICPKSTIRTDLFPPSVTVLISGVAGICFHDFQEILHLICLRWGVFGWGVFRWFSMVFDGEKWWFHQERKLLTLMSTVTSTVAPAWFLDGKRMGPGPNFLKFPEDLGDLVWELLLIQESKNSRALLSITRANMSRFSVAIIYSWSSPAKKSSSIAHFPYLSHKFPTDFPIETSIFFLPFLYIFP